MRISDAAKKLPRNVRPLLDKARVRFEGRRVESWLREFQGTHPKERTKRPWQGKSTAPEAWPGGGGLSLVHRLVFGRIGQVGKPMNTFTGCFGLGDERGSYVEYSQLIRTDLDSNKVEAQP